ncbi:MAG TPA: DUF6600 domain-containing protein [Stellaceae bacterium]|nr:DUF6600 domain-containing protein [Stellaceae bacterium]
MMDLKFPLLRKFSTVLVSTSLFGAGVAAWTPAQADDPPARVGRIAQVDGSVSMHSADEDHWDAATPNYPVTGGYSYWTEPGAHAALQVGAATLRMNGSTEVDVGALDDRTFQATVPQGAISFRLDALNDGESYQLSTPQGTVRINQPGRYRLDAGANGDPMLLTVFQGSAEFVGPNTDLTVNANQEARIIGTDSLQASVGTIQPEDFDRWVASQERPAPAAAPRYVSPEVVGYQDLDDHGSWRQTPDYGPVWYPQVRADWAPYREGHWAFVAPWGWTWVDDAPWGFAPFHYGRWVRIEDRWAWTPGEVVEHPVYAPALVAFVGGGDWRPSGVAIGVGVGIGIGVGAAVGWIPLGPHEVYHPYYPVSQNYVRNVNVSSVTNITVQKNVTVNNYVNQAAATVVPATAMTASQPVSTAAVRVPPQALASAPVAAANAPVTPTLATRGATPAVVRAAGGAVTPQEQAAYAHASRPGPAIHPASFTGTRPGGVAAPGQASVAPANVAPAGAAPANVGQARPAQTTSGQPASPPTRTALTVPKPGQPGQAATGSTPAIGRPTIPPPNAQAAQARAASGQAPTGHAANTPVPATQAGRPAAAPPATPVSTNRAAIAQAAGNQPAGNQPAGNQPASKTPGSPVAPTAPASHPVQTASIPRVAPPRVPTPPTPPKQPAVAQPAVAAPHVAAAAQPAPAPHPTPAPHPAAAPKPAPQQAAPKAQPVAAHPAPPVTAPKPAPKPAPKQDNSTDKDKHPS